MYSVNFKNPCSLDCKKHSIYIFKKTLHLKEGEKQINISFTKYVSGINLLLFVHCLIFNFRTDKKLIKCANRTKTRETRCKLQRCVEVFPQIALVVWIFIIIKVRNKKKQQIYFGHHCNEVRSHKEHFSLHSNFTTDCKYFF